MGLQFTGGVVAFSAEAPFAGSFPGKNHMHLQVSFQSKHFPTVTAALSLFRRRVVFRTVVPH